MTVIIGEKYRPLLAESLAAQGIEPIWMPSNPLFDPRLSGHADLSMVRRGREIVVSKGLNDNTVNIITNGGYSVYSAENDEGEFYPHDAGLCVLDTGRYRICNPKTVDPAALRLFSDRVLVPVAQGYTRCAAAVVNEHSIITADAGVSTAAKRAGLDVLDIEPGHVELAGFPYGFIGGASFPLNEDTLAFTGTLDAHPDKEQITAFLAARGVKPLFLTKGPLIDIGGAVILP